MQTFRNYLLALLGRRVSPPPFKPCVIYDDLSGHTEVVLRDTATVWHTLSTNTNGYIVPQVDVGYDFKGNLIAVRLKGNHRVRKSWST